MGAKVVEKTYLIDGAHTLVIREHSERTKKMKKLKKKWTFNIKTNSTGEMQRIPSFAVVDIFVMLMSFDENLAKEAALRDGIPEDKIEFLVKRRKEEIEDFTECFTEFSKSNEDMRKICESAIFGLAYFVKNPIEERNLGDLINLVTIGYKGCAMLFNCFEEDARPALTEEAINSQIAENSRRALESFDKVIMPILESNKTNTLLEAYRVYEDSLNAEKEEDRGHYVYVNATDYLVAQSGLHFEVPIESVFTMRNEIRESLQCHKNCSGDCETCQSKRDYPILSLMDLEVIKQSCVLTFKCNNTPSSAVIKCARFDNELFVIYEAHFQGFTEIVYEFKVNIKQRFTEEVIVLGEELMQNNVFDELLLQPSTIVGLLVSVNQKFQSRMSEKDEAPNTIRTQKPEKCKAPDTISSEKCEAPNTLNTLREVIRVSIDDTHLSNCKAVRNNKGTQHSHHGSPIMHWRRGHWRRTSKGQTFIKGQWINEPKNINSVVFVSNENLTIEKSS